MSSFLKISPAKLSRLVGTPSAPVILDVRTPEDFAADPRLIPTAKRCPHGDVADLADLPKSPVIVVCQKGRKLSEGAAAWLRHNGTTAEVLEGGFEAWREARLPLVPLAALPPRDARDRTVWVTRSRPKIDRVACPWLIRRFIDPEAVFLFVSAPEVLAVAERFNATPFDVEDVFWSHRGELCTFDLMIEEFGLAMPPLLKLATIVRAADTARPDLAPEAAGLLAASLGLSRMYSDDIQQIEAGFMLYDAFFRWCRDAFDETHNWPAAKTVSA
jgi:rhodanese-related sulfurtransferase